MAIRMPFMPARGNADERSATALEHIAKVLAELLDAQHQAMKEFKELKDHVKKLK